MDKASTDRLQVLVSSSEEERVLFGLNLALVAASSGISVTVFFALGSARWVCAEHASAGPVVDLIQQLAESEVPLHCCSTCVHEHCHDGDGLEVPLVDGVRRSGLASMLKRSVDGCETITI